MGDDAIIYDSEIVDIRRRPDLRIRQAFRRFDVYNF
jgi:hypothetical protein